jgi:hypothetical protein
MHYTLKMPAIGGEIVPLHAVAIAMAERDATAGNTPFHEPTYLGRLKGYILSLLEEVKSGRLQVCDDFGNPIEVDPNIEATAHFGYAEKYVKEPDWEKLQRETPPVGNGVWNFSHLNFGPKEIDKDSPNICWFTKLKMLNEWAEKRGDCFTISNEGIGWFDERGYNLPTQEKAEKPKGAEELPNTYHHKREKKDRGPIPDVSAIRPEHLYPTNQVARLLGVTQKYVQNDLIPNGTLRAEKIRSRYFVKGQTIRDYRESMKSG